MSPPQQKDRIRGFFLLFGMILLFTGIIKITAAMRFNRAAAAFNTRQIERWHRRVAVELPVEQRREWLKNSSDLPILLLKACTVESRIER